MWVQPGALLCAKHCLQTHPKVIENPHYSLGTLSFPKRPSQGALPNPTVAGAHRTTSLSITSQREDGSAGRLSVDQCCEKGFP